jgi:hypothetical protein
VRPAGFEYLDPIGRHAKLEVPIDSNIVRAVGRYWNETYFNWNELTNVW